MIPMPLHYVTSEAESFVVIELFGFTIKAEDMQWNTHVSTHTKPFLRGLLLKFASGQSAILPEWGNAEKAETWIK